MILNYHIDYTLKAQDDLDSIYSYIFNNLSNPNSAFKIISDIISSIKLLRIFPYSHPKYFPLKYSPYECRKLVVNKKYVIIYSVDKSKQEITIIRIFHGSQNYLNLL